MFQNRPDDFSRAGFRAQVVVGAPDRIDHAGQVTRIGQQHAAVVRALLRDTLMAQAHEAVGQVTTQWKPDQVDQLHGRRKFERG